MRGKKRERERENSALVQLLTWRNVFSNSEAPSLITSRARASVHGLTNEIYYATRTVEGKKMFPIHSGERRRKLNER